MYVINVTIKDQKSCLLRDYCLKTELCCYNSYYYYHQVQKSYMYVLVCIGVYMYSGGAEGGPSGAASNRKLMIDPLTIM